MAKYENQILSRTIKNLLSDGHTVQQIGTYLERLMWLPWSRLTEIVNAVSTPRIERALGGALISMAAAGQIDDVLYLLEQVEAGKIQQELGTIAKMN